MEALVPLLELGVKVLRGIVDVLPSAEEGFEGWIEFLVPIIPIFESVFGIEGEVQTSLRSTGERFGWFAGVMEETGGGFDAFGKKAHTGFKSAEVAVDEGTLSMIDDMVAAGTITQQQAQKMKDAMIQQSLEGANGGKANFTAWADGAKASAESIPRNIQKEMDRAEADLRSRNWFSSGASLVDGFADGMLGSLFKVRNAASRIVSEVGSFFPNSPAKQGPFSGKGWTPYRGQALVDGFTEGMESRIQDVRNTAAMVMSAADGIGGVSALTAAGSATGGGSTFNIYAAEGQSPEATARAVSREISWNQRVGAGL